MLRYTQVQKAEGFLLCILQHHCIELDCLVLKDAVSTKRCCYLFSYKGHCRKSSGQGSPVPLSPKEQFISEFMSNLISQSLSTQSLSVLKCILTAVFLLLNRKKEIQRQKPLAWTHTYVQGVKAQSHYPNLAFLPWNLSKWVCIDRQECHIDAAVPMEFLWGLDLRGCWVGEYFPPVPLLLARRMAHRNEEQRASAASASWGH